MAYSPSSGRLPLDHSTYALGPGRLAEVHVDTTTKDGIEAFGGAAQVMRAARKKSFELIVLKHGGYHAPASTSGKGGGSLGQ